MASLSQGRQRPYIRCMGPGRLRWPHPPMMSRRAWASATCAASTRRRAAQPLAARPHGGLRSCLLSQTGAALIPRPQTAAPSVPPTPSVPPAQGGRGRPAPPPPSRAAENRAATGHSATWPRSGHAGQRPLPPVRAGRGPGNSRTGRISTLWPTARPSKATPRGSLTPRMQAERPW